MPYWNLPAYRIVGEPLKAAGRENNANIEVMDTDVFDVDVANASSMGKGFSTGKCNRTGNPIDTTFFKLIDNSSPEDSRSIWLELVSIFQHR